ncbi:MAG: hypothetical protein HPY44_12200 [Armatimonadetes bacterium]|nr:hypothetical protein [Armatimonadota bacterium]
MPSRAELLRRAEEGVRKILEQGNSGANRNPEKAQFIAPMAGFTSFAVPARPVITERRRST